MRPSILPLANHHLLGLAGYNHSYVVAFDPQNLPSESPSAALVAMRGDVHSICNARCCYRYYV